MAKKASAPTTAPPTPPAVAVAPPSASAAASTSVNASRTFPWVPGLLELPANEARRVQLVVRATWPHMAERLADRAKVASTVRAAVVDLIGDTDEVLVGMVLRHLDLFAASHQELRPHELAHLLAILVGAESATKLARAVIAVLEEGLQESWYEKQMRKKYGAG